MYAPCGLFLLHGIGEDVIPSGVGEVAAELPDNNAPLDEDIERIHFLKYCARKARQTAEAARDVSFRCSLTTSLWAGEAPEKLNNVLQHLEGPTGQGKGLLDATYERGPVYDAEVDLFRRATSSEHTIFPLSGLVHHYQFQAEQGELDLVDFERDAFARIVDIAAQVWTRAYMLFQSPPFSLAQLKDPRATSTTKARIRDLMLVGPSCEADPGFTGVVQEVLQSEPLDVGERMLDEFADSVISAVAQYALTTNMSVWLAKAKHVFLCFLSTPGEI